MAITRDEVLDSFVEETSGRLVEMEDQLLALQSADEGQLQVLVNALFRHAHSIKGASNLLGFKDIEFLSHRMEHVLDMLRTGVLAPSPRIHAALIQGLDVIGAFLDHPEEGAPSNLREVMLALSRVAVSG